MNLQLENMQTEDNTKSYTFWRWMNIQKTISREEEEEYGYLLEVYRGKTEEEAKDRGTYQMK